MNRWRIESAALAAAVILAAALLAASIAVPIRRATAQPMLPTPSTQLSYCNGSVTSTLSAAAVRICDPVTVTAVITPVCQGCGGGLNVVFAHPLWIERGRWMMAENYAALDLMEEWQKKGLRMQAAVLEIDPMVVGTRIDTLADLSEDLGRARAKLVSRDGLGGGYQCGGWDKAVRKGIAMLDEDRHDSGLAPCEAFVNYACDVPNPGPSPEEGLLRQAQAMAGARGAGAFFGCPFNSNPGSIYRGFCLGVAKVIQRSSYFEWPEQGRLRQMFAAYDGQLTTQNGQSLHLWQRLPAGLTYVSGSASVTPTTVSTVAGETVLAWAWTTAEQVVPHQVAYQVRPAQEGQWPVSGEGMIVDKQRRNRLFSMQPLTVAVAGLCQTPTPAATPTDTPTPTSTATPPPTATSTPTATARPRPIYLPLTLKEECVKGQRQVDVALVIDASTSMLDETSTGRSKLDTARAAVRTFLDQLHLDAGDQATIIAFNAEATILQTLTANHTALDQALDRIQTAQQTRIHRGIEEAAKELTSPRHFTGNTPAMIVLTDGRANPDSREVAVAQAALAKAAGITVFTVGIGNEVDFDALERMASQPSFFYRAPKAEDLEGIYRAIARMIPCPPNQFWGGR